MSHEKDSKTLLASVHIMRHELILILLLFLLGAFIDLFIFYSLDPKTMIIDWSMEIYHVYLATK